MFEAGFTCILSKSFMNTRTNKKTSFVYLTKEVFLNDVCLRQMMSFH